MSFSRSQMIVYLNKMLILDWFLFLKTLKIILLNQCLIQSKILRIPFVCGLPLQRTHINCGSLSLSRKVTIFFCRAESLTFGQRIGEVPWPDRNPPIK